MVPIIPTTAVEEGSEERQNFEDGVAKKTLQPGWRSPGLGGRGAVCEETGLAEQRV